MNGIAAVFYRDYRQRVTSVAFLVWDLMIPLAYLLLFGLGFDGLLRSGVALEGQQVTYTAFLLPGILAMVTFYVALNTSWGFFMDKDSGIFYELLTFPITRQQLLIGKIAFNVLVSLIGSLLAMLVALFAMGVEIRLDLLPLTAFLVVVTTGGWFFLFAIAAISMKRMDSFNTLTSAAYILLMFLSTMFYPLDGLPVWFQTAAMLNPMTWQVDLLRFSLLGSGTSTLLMLEAAAFAVFTAISLAFAARTLNRVA
jgi:ABC-2 type transport system permease protein